MKAQSDRMFFCEVTGDQHFGCLWLPALYSFRQCFISIYNSIVIQSIMKFITDLCHVCGFITTTCVQGFNQHLPTPPPSPLPHPPSPPSLTVSLPIGTAQHPCTSQTSQHFLMYMHTSRECYYNYDIQVGMQMTCLHL